MSVPFRLRVEGGPNAGQEFALTATGTTIGRQDGNTIVLDDGRLSRQHARVDLGPEGLTLTDLGSANGTRVNGQRVSGTQPLHGGDRIQMGETIIVVEGSAARQESGATVVVPTAQGPTTPMPPRGAGAPRLVQQGDGRAYPLDRPAMVIGRQPGNEIAIADLQSSRQHARFDLQGGQLTVTDLGSANGTHVNGARISGPTPLRDGDQVRIGTSEYRVEGLGVVGLPPPPDATVVGSPPFAVGGAPFGQPAGSGTAPLPPLGSPPPPQFSPANQPWAAPGPQPQFGAPPQFGAGVPSPGQVGVPPAPPRRNSGKPLLIGGLVALLLFLCVGGALGGFLVYRSRSSDPTPTVTASGTSVVGAANRPSATPSGIAFPGGAAPFPGGGGSAPPFPGGGGTSPAPLPSASAAPPSVAPVPTPTVAPVPTVAPTVTVAPTATLAATATPRPTVTIAPTRVAPTPTTRPAQSAPPSGGGLTITVDSVGLRFALPAGWTQERDEAGRATFLAPDRRAQIVVRWSTQAPAGLTAQQLVQNELQATANEDPAFSPSSAKVGTVTFGGQPGYGTDPYSYSLTDGTRLTEADRAVVLSGRAQYFFGFVAAESEFPRYATIFDAIISTVTITGP